MHRIRVWQAIAGGSFPPIEKARIGVFDCGICGTLLGMEILAQVPTTTNANSMPRSHYDSENQRWEGLIRNAPDADGHYFYAVKTTGVYCRPTCPSRVPLRKNVIFFDTGTAAEEAGFRPCKRCQPSGTALEDEYAQKIAQACRFIEQADEGPSLETLAREVAMSKYHFHRLFVQVVGMTPKAYHKHLRAERLRGELARGNSVTQAIYEAGYSTNRQFYEEATQILGMRPQNYRDGGKRESICFALGECSLGSVLVASSLKGICALSLGDEPEKLIQELEMRFPHAELIGGDHHYEQLVARVIGFIESSQEHWNLPLDIRGTAFQRLVWQALQNVPPGSHISYKELATNVGCPKAFRAVASACAANHLAVAIPCHRVVRQDGSLSGYRWGVDRKRELLEREDRENI